MLVPWLSSPFVGSILQHIGGVLLLVKDTSRMFFSSTSVKDILVLGSLLVVKMQSFEVFESITQRDLHSLFLLSSCLADE